MSSEVNTLREFGEFRLDVRKRVLWHEGEPVNLALKEIDLLCVLTENGGEVVTKAELLDRVWPDTFVEESNLSRHIYLLRKRLKDLGHGGDFIQNVPRRGYRFTFPVHPASNGELVIEKYTSTKTLIEFRDNDTNDPVPTPAGTNNKIRVSSRTLILSVIGGVLLLSAAVALSRSFFAGAGVPAGAAITSIAVLPVKSFSEAADDDELRMRITDALITRLGNIDRIAVRPTSAVLPFADSADDSLAIGQKLRVDAVIDSRLQSEGSKLRVTMQLIRVTTGEDLWSGQFDGEADKILELQDQIYAKVSRSLNAAGSDRAGFAKRPTQSSDAYEAYLKGRYFWADRDEASLRKAIGYFEQAVALDPQFSEAYSGLADTKHLLFNYNIDVRPAIVEDAKNDLRRALELKPDSADALITLGTIQMGYDWDWAAAEASFKRAIAAAPNSSLAHARYGALLVRIRKFDESQTEFERSTELDPLSIVANTNIGLVLFCKRDYEAADRQFNKTLELDDKIGSTHWLLSRSLWQQGRKDESVQEIVRGLELDGNSSLAAKLKQQVSPQHAIDRLLHEWKDDPSGTNPHNLAYLSMYANDKDRAIYWLERSVSEHHPWTAWIAAAPEFEPLRADPRFQSLLTRMNLP